MSIRQFPLLIALASISFLHAVGQQAAGVTTPAANQPPPQSARSSTDASVLDIRTHRPSRPGFRETQPVTLPANPFTPLSRLSNNSLEYLLPILSPKITGVTVAEEASSFTFEGREVYIGGSIKYPKRTDNSLLAFFADGIEDAKAPASQSTEGSLRVRSIKGDSVVMVDDTGYEITIPVASGSAGVDSATGERSGLRTSYAGTFSIGVLSSDGARIHAVLPGDIPPTTVLRFTTRFSRQRTAVVESYRNGVAMLRVEGEPIVRPKAADIVPIPKMAGLYALATHGATNGADLVGIPLDRKDGRLFPRGSSVAPSRVAGATVWDNGRLQGFIGADLRMLPSGIADAERVELCIVVYTGASL